VLELASVVTLVIVFALATVLPINMGVLALTGAFLLGAASGLSNDEVLALFPGDVFVLVVGITLLFGVARANGTMALFVQAALRLVGERRRAVPWLIFVIAGVLMSFGFVLAVGILAPVAMQLASRYRVRPLLMAMMVSHGALAASLSPVTVYAAFTQQVSDKAGVDVASWELFGAGFVLNLVFAVVAYLIWGRDLGGTLDDEPPAGAAPAASTPPGHPETVPGRPSEGGVLTAAPSVPALQLDGGSTYHVTLMRVLTFVGIISLVVGAALGANIGVVAVVAATALLLMAPARAAESFKDVGWGVLLLVCGMLTLMSVLTANGTVAWVADHAAALGMPLLAILLVLFVVGLVSAIGSSVATIGIALSLAFPLLAQGSLPAVGVVIAISVCALVVDVSPFSTNGALVLANADVPDRRRFQNEMLAYTGAVCVLAPLALWLCLVVVPG
jgi:di/tricarboxylate transporter